MQYRCETVSVSGFVQQLVNLIRHGYRFYVTGVVPAGKDAKVLDAKLIDKYDLNLREWTRCRRKKAGRANVQYLRYGRFFVLIATHGEHQFFNSMDDPEKPGEGKRDANDVERRIRNLRDKSSVKFHGYSISQRQSADKSSWHVHVRIDKEHYRELKAHWVDIATRRTVEAIIKEIRSVRFEAYYPVKRQMSNILRAMNRERKLRGFRAVPSSVFRTRVRIVKPFGEILPGMVGEAA